MTEFETRLTLHLREARSPDRMDAVYPITRILQQRARQRRVAMLAGATALLATAGLVIAFGFWAAATSLVDQSVDPLSLAALWVPFALLAIALSAASACSVTYILGRDGKKPL